MKCTQRIAKRCYVEERECLHALIRVLSGGSGCIVDDAVKFAMQPKMRLLYVCDVKPADKYSDIDAS